MALFTEEELDDAIWMRRHCSMVVGGEPDFGESGFDERVDDEIDDVWNELESFGLAFTYARPVLAVALEDLPHVGSQVTNSGCHVRECFLEGADDVHLSCVMGVSQPDIELPTVVGRGLVIGGGSAAEIALMDKCDDQLDVLRVMGQDVGAIEGSSVVSTIPSLSIMHVPLVLDDPDVAVRYNRIYALGNLGEIIAVCPSFLPSLDLWLFDVTAGGALYFSFLDYDSCNPLIPIFNDGDRFLYMDREVVGFSVLLPRKNQSVRLCAARFSLTEFYRLISDMSVTLYPKTKYPFVHGTLVVGSVRRVANYNPRFRPDPYSFRLNVALERGPRDYLRFITHHVPIDAEVLLNSNWDDMWVRKGLPGDRGYMIFQHETVFVVLGDGRVWTFAYPEAYVFKDCVLGVVVTGACLGDDFGPGNVLWWDMRFVVVTDVYSVRHYGPMSFTNRWSYFVALTEGVDAFPFACATWLHIDEALQYNLVDQDLVIQPAFAVDTCTSYSVLCYPTLLDACNHVIWSLDDRIMPTRFSECLMLDTTRNRARVADTMETVDFVAYHHLLHAHHAQMDWIVPFLEGVSLRIHPSSMQTPDMVQFFNLGFDRLFGGEGGSARSYIDAIRAELYLRIRGRIDHEVDEAI